MMKDVKDLKETLKELAKEFGYEITDDYNYVNITSDIINTKEFKTIIMFKNIIDYLEEKELKDNGFYD